MNPEEEVDDPDYAKTCALAQFQRLSQMPEKACRSCGEKVAAKIARTERNFGRRFYAHDRHPPGLAKWFEWIDPPFVSNAILGEALKKQQKEMDELRGAVQEARDLVQGVMDMWNSKEHFEALLAGNKRKKE